MRINRQNIYKSGLYEVCINLCEELIGIMKIHSRVRRFKSLTKIVNYIEIMAYFEISFKNTGIPRKLLREWKGRYVQFQWGIWLFNLNNW